MKILILSDYIEWSVLYYVIRALKKTEHEVVCFGPYWFKGKNCPQELSSILSSIKMKPEMILIVETQTGKPLYTVLGLDEVNIPKVFWAIDNHLNFRWHKEYSYIFDKTYFAQKTVIDHTKRYGVEGIDWLPLACDPEIHTDLSLNRDIDIGFVGKIGKRRKEIFGLLRESLEGVKFGIYKGVFGREMAKIYSRSKIIINPSIRKDINMRTFEATACGALLLNEDIKGLKELFKIGEEIDTYLDVDSLIEKIRFYLKNDSIREMIAQQGKRRSLKNHTYEKRLSHILAERISKPLRKKERIFLSYGVTLRHRQFKQYDKSNRYLLKAFRINPFFTIHYYIRYFKWYMFEKLRKVLKKWPY
ncbi:MAG: glycosyltransferase [Candidatus Cloacimonadota bacterium]|nr:MAG: glycosyltransferase [Candidatus Cloacimonadota bacterium]